MAIGRRFIILVISQSSTQHLTKQIRIELSCALERFVLDILWLVELKMAVNENVNYYNSSRVLRRQFRNDILAHKFCHVRSLLLTTRKMKMPFFLFNFISRWNCISPVKLDEKIQYECKKYCSKIYAQKRQWSPPESSLKSSLKS